MTARLAFGFHNPNHAAALACALLPLCWGWRRAAWVGRSLALALFAAVLLTQSRTGLLVAVLEGAAWWTLRRRARASGVPAHPSPTSRAVWTNALGLVALLSLALWRVGPRLVLDGSILNRPRIWLAGLRLFAANPDGVGLGNSGALASAFLLDGIPDVRTLVSAHLTLLAEFGWIAGWAWFAFAALALCGVRRSPRAGLAFAGLLVSAAAATVFDWPVLFDHSGLGGLGRANWILSWATLALFAAFGVRLSVAGLRAAGTLRAVIRRASAALAVAALPVLVARLVPPGNAPQVQDGYAAAGAAPRTLALYDASWGLREVCARAGRDVLVPVRPVSRYPSGLGLDGVGRVLLFGDCREWVHLVPKGVPVTCSED